MAEVARATAIHQPESDRQVTDLPEVATTPCGRASIQPITTFGASDPDATRKASAIEWEQQRQYRAFWPRRRNLCRRNL